MVTDHESILTLTCCTSIPTHLRIPLLNLCEKMSLTNLNDYQPYTNASKKSTHSISAGGSECHRQPAQQRTRDQRPEDRDPEKVLLERNAEGCIGGNDAYSVEANERQHGNREYDLPREPHIRSILNRPVMQVS